jgi:hypothetical protein
MSPIAASSHPHPVQIAPLHTSRELTNAVPATR